MVSNQLFVLVGSGVTAKFAKACAVGTLGASENDDKKCCEMMHDVIGE